MVAFDCVHDSHEDAQFTAETRTQLLDKVLAHFDSYHPEIGKKDVIERVTASAYDPEVRAQSLARLAHTVELPGVGAEAGLTEPDRPH